MSVGYCVDRNQTNTCFGILNGTTTVPANGPLACLGNETVSDILFDNLAQVPTCPTDDVFFDCALHLNDSCERCHVASVYRLGADLQKALNEASGIHRVAIVL